MSSRARTVDVDVVVAGAGGAGLSTALRASEFGLSVAVFETTEHFRSGNNTSMSTSMIPAGGSRWQRAEGVDDSPEAFADDVVAKTKGTAEPTVTAALTGVAPALVAWLDDSCGVDLSLVTDFNYPGHSTFRCHTVKSRSGQSLLRSLLSALDRRPEVTLVAPMTVESVSVDREGAVAGVGTVGGGGAKESVTCRAVVLASGGFGANRDLVADLIPEMAGATYHGGDACRGDALAIGRALGVDVGYLDAYQGHGGLATPHAIIVTWATVMHGGVIVDVEGRRFADETQGYSEFAELVLNQPEGVAFVVIDGDIDRKCQSFADYQALVANHAIRWATSIEELAVAIGACPDVLAAEIDKVASLAGTTGTDRFGRAGPPHALEAPFGFVKVTGALFHTQGGLMVSKNAAVLRGGEEVPGLYAAGGAAVGMSGHGASGYLAGNGLLGALGLGYLAGTDCGAQFTG